MKFFGKSRGTSVISLPEQLIVEEKISQKQPLHLYGDTEEMIVSRTMAAEPIADDSEGETTACPLAMTAMVA